MRFQQLTGPVMAKGLEDTAFYNYNRLISLNDVGGDPGTFGTSVAKFHAHNAYTAANWPHTLVATSTHDTKRGEDARARINVLSEFATDWQAALQRWSDFNAGKKTRVDGKPAPSANDEYLFYQTLIGVWPDQQRPEQGRALQQSPALSRAGKERAGERRRSSELAELEPRLLAYMLKAAKESKRHTSWLEPNLNYETALQKFISATLDPKQSGKFLNDFRIFHQKIAFFGYLNSLSQVLLKLTAPGLPDLYQGCELWDFSLVDPDNRRPVDFKFRKEMLDQLKSREPFDAQTLCNLLAEPESAAAKMYVIWRTLQFRSAHSELFRFGSYTALETQGQKQDHVIGFERKNKKESVIVVAGRLFGRLTGGQTRLPPDQSAWADTVVSLNPKTAPGHFKNLFTGETVQAHQHQLRLAEIFRSFPIAILVPDAIWQT